MHPIKIQGNPSHCRAVAHMIGLSLIDCLHPWQRSIPDLKGAPNLTDPGLFQRRSQLGKMIGVQHRIAATCEDQIPLQNPA